MKTVKTKENDVLLERIQELEKNAQEIDALRADSAKEANEARSQEHLMKQNFTK